jgi:hypothetical protein
MFVFLARDHGKLLASISRIPRNQAWINRVIPVFLRNGYSILGSLPLRADSQERIRAGTSGKMRTGKVVSICMGLRNFNRVLILF